jgi:glycosyltransferase involved in cell wall biosynthesis
METVVTWFGPFEDTGAYATINRQLSTALERRGWRVLRNQHNDGLSLTPIAVAHVYPPRALNVTHPHTIALTAWEFAGALGVPLSFIPALKGYDQVCAPAHWTAAIIGAALDREVQVVPWGVDPDEFTPDGDRYPLPDDGRTRVLWAGGTDKRHGFDLAVAMLDMLPDDFVLITKQSVHYPAEHTDHPRVVIIRDDLPSMAPLYRACDLFVHSASGVGFALHCLEALACGLPVASTALPPVLDYASDRVVLAEPGTWRVFDHHLHRDCVPEWMETGAEALAQTVQQAAALPKLTALSPDFLASWSWDHSAEVLERVLLSVGVRHEA